MDPDAPTAPTPSGLAIALQDQARRTPDRAAVWDIQRSLTYAELDARVGALALRIAERYADGGGTGVIPMVVGREIGAVIAIHAFVRAGVPSAQIDAGIPAAALAALWHRLDDPTVAVVGDASMAGLLPHGVDAIDPWGRIDAELAPAPIDRGALAKVIFTSGSSGEPKGVMTTWGPGESMVTNPMLVPPPGVTDDRTLAATPFGFGGGLLAAMRPAFGTAVSILDPNAHDPLDFVERIDADRLSTIALVPSMLPAVFERWPAGRRLEAVRSTMAFGEALDWSAVALMRRLLPETAVVFNAFGATESGAATFALAITSGMPLGSGRVALGRPVSPDVVRLEPISDDPADPVEVIARGPNVALGYWRDPEQTARVFGQEDDGTRFWRSGDLVRLDAEGLAHFVGRRDNVVKINGKLVEPSEPERVLREVPGVRRAVVLVQPAPRGGQRLVAHVEVDPDMAPDPADVRSAVAEQVAAHLVPAVIVRHETLPYTAGGKVDRQALLRAEPAPWHERTSDRPPTLNEAAVLAVASEVLGFDGIGPDDDLWDLGLDSLGATELLATLTDFGWAALPESTLLEHRTAASLARLRGQFVPTGDAIWLNDGGDGAPVVCVLGPSSDALTFRRLAQELAPDHPVGIVRQFDPASSADVPRTVPDIAAGVRRTAERGLHGAARDSDQPTVVVGYSGSGVVAYDLARQWADDGIDVHVVLIDAPAGARTIVDHGRYAAGGDVAARLRRTARQALVRALPASAMPQRERAYARFDLAGKAAMEYEPPTTDLPVTLFRAVDSGLPDLGGAWSPATPHLTVVDVDCDHDAILGAPHIGVVAEHVRRVAVASG